MIMLQIDKIKSFRDNCNYFLKLFGENGDIKNITEFFENNKDNFQKDFYRKLYTDKRIEYTEELEYLVMCRRKLIDALVEADYFLKKIIFIKEYLFFCEDQSLDNLDFEFLFLEICIDSLIENINNEIERIEFHNSYVEIFDDSEYEKKEFAKKQIRYDKKYTERKQILMLFLKTCENIFFDSNDTSISKAIKALTIHKNVTDKTIANEIGEKGLTHYKEEIFNLAISKTNDVLARLMQNKPT